MSDDFGVAGDEEGKIEMAKIARALVSVSDKAGLVEFVKGLREFGVEVLSTGGTAKLLADAGIPVVAVSAYTGSPEILDGRVKTLHPKIHGGLLGVRSNPDHLREMHQYNIESIDMIVVNVNSIESLTNNVGLSLDEAMNKIDIGGMALLRSAAKNFASVTVVVDPKDYGMIADDIRNNSGSVSPETNLKLAVKVFETTSRYDSLLAEFLQQKEHGDSSERKHIEIPRLQRANKQ
ncbi:MAG TPA: hypothetical protein VMT89_02605 [Candidatus Acidoferrales bacterium]|nr:hypothetical protein [Candidatus Acidoferrales bacterium]